MTKDTKFPVKKILIINRIKMSTCNTSFNIIIEEQIAKLSNVQSVIKLILEKNHTEDVVSRLKTKYEELQNFTEKLKELKNALNYQVNLCGDIKKISGTLNILVQQITAVSEDVPFKTEEDSSVPTPRNDTLEITNTASSSYYSPLENQVYNDAEIKPIRPTSLNFNTFEIEPLTQEEFTMIPKYMLGRNTLDGINKFVDVFNKTLQIKYNILTKQKSTLKGPELQQYRDYKHQETEDTKGKYFVTERDIAKQQQKKNLEKSTYNLLVILRHTKRLYENRIILVVIMLYYLFSIV